MKKENDDSQKPMGKSLEDHHKEINELRRKVDVLEAYRGWLEEYRDLKMPRTVLDKAGDRKEIV